MTKPVIGFIGLGLMGSAIVGHLQRQGFQLNVMANRSRAPIDKAVANGAIEYHSPKEVAEHSDIIMLCMDTSANVEARMRGDDGIIAGLRKGAFIVDFGTSLPASTRALANEVAAAGGAMLDSPLGRTPAHAEDGLLNLMVGGDKAAFDAIEDVLKVIGENVFYLGASGAGHTVKLLNNFLGMTTANVVAEIYASADLAGVSRKAVYDVISSGPLHSPMMDFVSAYALDGDDSKLAFAIKNGAKDIGYYGQMLKDAGVESAIVGAPAAAMNEAVAAGLGDELIPKMMDHFLAKMK